MEPDRHAPLPLHAIADPGVVVGLHPNVDHAVLLEGRLLAPGGAFTIVVLEEDGDSLPHLSDGKWVGRQLGISLPCAGERREEFLRIVRAQANSLWETHRPR